MLEMATSDSGDIVVKEPSITMEDIVGQEDAKQTILEWIILPAKFPHLFTGFRNRSATFLLYGPPGVGKSMIAEATAASIENCSLLKLSNSALVSKYLNDRDKLIRDLFDLAHHNAPCVLFLDELDCLCAWRTESSDIAEAMRRLRVELVCQLDGYKRDGIHVMFASNCPWDIDLFVFKRMSKKIGLTLPDRKDRVEMFKKLLGGKHSCELSDDDYVTLGDKADGLSGSDIVQVVNEVLVEPVRKTRNATHFKQVSASAASSEPTSVSDLWTPCSPEAEGAKAMTWSDVSEEQLQHPAIKLEDIQRILGNTKPTVSSEYLQKFQKFHDMYV